MLFNKGKKIWKEIESETRVDVEPFVEKFEIQRKMVIEADLFSQQMRR